MTNVIVGDDLLQNPKIASFLKKKYSEKTQGSLRIYMQGKKKQ